MYMVLGLSNPFPIDWMYPNDFIGSSHRLVQAARTLDRQGDYLALFQTVPVETLDQYSVTAYNGLVGAARKLVTAPLPYSYEPLQQIRDALHGEALSCGTFVGVYDPPRHTSHA